MTDVTDVVLPDEMVNELSKTNRWSDAELRKLAKAENPYEAALEAAAELYGDVTDISDDLGNGFSLLDDKSKLVGQKMVILSVGFNDGDFGKFVTVATVTEDGKHYIFNDGSTGIFEQLYDLVRTTRRWGGWKVTKGLRVSSYEWTDEKGKTHPASTYYIDTSTE